MLLPFISTDNHFGSREICKIEKSLVSYALSLSKTPIKIWSAYVIIYPDNPVAKM